MGTDCVGRWLGFGGEGDGSAGARVDEVGMCFVLLFVFRRAWHGKEWGGLVRTERGGEGGGGS